MSLSAGTRLGPYEILAAIGAGGMGEVYRARDTRLDRTVAIKVLPAHLAVDPQFRERFDREAHAIAALSHPHICALYDVGEAALAQPLASSPQPPEMIRFLVEADSAATFALPDFLLFARQGTLLAQRLNLGRLEPIGEPLPVAPRVAKPATIAAVALSSSSGLIAYRPDAGKQQLVWRDRSGRQLSVLGSRDADQPSEIRLSPDGRTVVLRRTTSGNTDVWLIETTRGVMTRLTSNTGNELHPIWSPDGRRVAFTSDRNGGLDDLYVQPIDGTSAETLLLATAEYKTVSDWSPDGRFILFIKSDQTTGPNVWVLPMFGDRKPSPVVQTEFTENNARFSPDGRWIAYQSNESGRPEIYVQPFPGTSGKSQVSTNGGTVPRWRGDGRELFYLGPDNVLMAVPLTLNGSTVEAGAPAGLFSMQAGSEYAASPDGQRFLVNTQVEDPAPITILLNWRAGIEKIEGR